MNERSAADEEIMRLATENEPGEAAAAPAAKPEAKPDETLELGGEDAPELTEEQKAEAEEKRKGRSHSPVQRINALTARLRDAERALAESETRHAPPQDAEPQAPNPNDEKYEFGTADPQFIKDSALFEVRKELADERKATAEKDKQNAAQNELSTKLSDGVRNVEKSGPEKYDDFDQKIGDALEARGGEPLPPLLSIGIAVSPAGADVAYRLATDEAAVSKLEKLSQTNPHAAAIAFGELEGEYLEDDSDGDLNPADPLDLARMLGRERARRKGGGVRTEVRTTKAPKPPEHSARGASGKFEVSDDTDDFAAFERKYSSKR